MTAWDAWQAEQARIQGEHFPEALDDAANNAADEAAALAARIAALPALTADGFRVKLRALSHYKRNTLLAEIPDDPDPDQLVSHSLWRDMQEPLPAPTPANVLTAAILDLWREWAADEKVEQYDEALQQRRFGLIDAAEELPATLENIAPKALALAWLEYVDQWRKGCSRLDYTTDGRLALDIHAAAAQTPTSTAVASAAPRESSLVGLIDFASASLEDLQALHDTANLVGDVAYAVCWQSRCHARDWGERDMPGARYNAAGELMQWLGDALTDVETAANSEARRRSSAKPMDREKRLQILALPVIQNGDPDEIEAFARDLLAHAQAERRGR